MSADNKNTGTYTAADIERYLKGQMTAAEKHALEKAALEDPFLAEAMEGYAGMPDLPVESDITALKQRVGEKNAVNKIIPMRKYRVWWSAAAAILLVAGTATTWYLFNQSPQHEIAQKTREIQPPAAQSAAVPDSLNANEAEDKSVQPEEPKVPEPEEKKQVLIRPDKNVASIDTVSGLSGNKAAEIAPAPEPATALQSPGNPLKDEVEAKAKDVVADKQDITRSATQASPIQRERVNAYLPSHIFKGRITDSNNKPLPFVNITAAGVHTYTDAQGNFTILSGDSIVSASVRSVGYEPKNAVLASNTPLNNIKLSPGNNGLSEVVVQGYALKKAKEVRKEDEEETAEPVDGWGNYDIYLSNNKRLPSEKNKTTGGFVEVSFIVNKAGMLYDFKIERSTCSACNKEAIRLIKEGPKWRLTEGDQPGKITVTIQF
jgi:hypothetical protein